MQPRRLMRPCGVRSVRHKQMMVGQVLGPTMTNQREMRIKYIGMYMLL